AASATGRLYGVDVPRTLRSAAAAEIAAAMTPTNSTTKTSQPLATRRSIFSVRAWLRAVCCPPAFSCAFGDTNVVDVVQTTLAGVKHIGSALGLERKDGYSNRRECQGQRTDEDYIAETAQAADFPTTLGARRADGR